MVNIDIYPEDKPCFASGVKLVKEELVDTYNGRTYVLSGQAHQMLALMNGSRSADEIVRIIAQEYSQHYGRVWDDFVSILNDLNAQYLLSWKTTYKEKIRLQRLKFYLLNIHNIFDSDLKKSRIPPSIYLLFLNVLRANFLLLFISLCVSLGLVVVVYGQGVFYYGFMHNKIALFLPLVITCLFVVTIFAHEFGHLLVATRLGLQPFIVRKGMQVSVVHISDQRNAVRLSAVAGALSGTTMSLIWAGIFYMLPYFQFVSFFMLVLVGVHMYSLAPWTADGKNLWRKNK
ncbi:MAG: hypothetical protein J6M18_02710 [Actinomycetaceae bacterium]|nr:hypothetical protein [Actinomycetaceae bacterium]